MFSAIKSFAKRNRVLFILLIVAVSITCYSDFCAIFEGLKSYVSEYKVQYIRPLTLAEIAFFEARMSLAKQAKGGIPHIYMKGCN